MGFLPSFLLLHPSLFEIEAQGQKQQLNSYVLLPGCQKPAEPKIILYQSEGPFYLDGSVHPYKKISRKDHLKV